ncbi:MAG: RluA family pseudouridine synthase [Patescibacteria group bacterium]
MEIEIIYEDAELIVINKPWGITVNRSDSSRENTVQDWAEKKLNIKNKISKNKNDEKQISNYDTEEEFVSRGGVVHRLDKETSGILLIAKNPKSFLNLKNQFKERKVEKTYVALVHGEVKSETGEINAPVGRLPQNRMRFGVIADGREASTGYEVINHYLFDKEKLTYLRLKPKTGRTHQIRVHLKYLIHPIFSDPLYAGRKVGRNDRKVLGRLFLHAEKITFLHPTTGEIQTFESKLPEELQKFMDILVKA